MISRNAPSHSKPNFRSNAPSVRNPSLQPALQQSLKGKQKLVLQTKMLAGLQLLALPLSEIKQKVSAALEENPFLEANDELSPAISIEESVEKLQREEKQYSLDDEDNSHERLTPNSQLLAPATSQTHTQDKSLTTIIEETAAHTTTLEDELLLQLVLVYERESPQYKIGNYLIAMIDKDGFLSKENIQAAETAFENENLFLSEVVDTLKTFYPTGIASANTQEALLTQIRKLRHETRHSEDLILKLAEKLIFKYFTQISSHHKLENLTKTLEVKREHMDQALKQISLLEPKPARNYSQTNNTYIEPEATIEAKNDTLELILHHDPLSRIRISPSYTTYLKTIQEKKTPSSEDKTFETYLKQHKQQAEELIENLTYRKSNLEKVLSHLMEHQKDFFLKGFEYLKPYAISQMANNLKLDKGTISRLVNLKYVATPQGLLPLRQLFSASKIQLRTSTDTSTPSTPASPQALQTLIKEIIEGYPNKKLSDQKITEMLQLRGYQIARRTVTKYRQKMQILPSFERKKTDS